MNPHAQALGKLGGLANKGRPKSESHKIKMREALSKARSMKSPKVEGDTCTPVATTVIPVRKCQAPYCNAVAHAVEVQGLTAWLCSNHD